jgi:hypothetical protein
MDLGAPESALRISKYLALETRDTLPPSRPSVPHLFDFFLSKGWETTNPNSKSSPDPPQLYFLAQT